MVPDPSPRSRLVTAALLLAVAAMLAGCTPGVSPPSICSVCDDRMVQTAADHGANVTVTHSETHLHVRTDGSARWEVHVDLEGEGVAAFRSNETLRRQVVEQRLRENSGPAPSNPGNLSVAMDGRTLVVTFEDPGLGEMHAGGVVVVDTFNYQTDGTVPAPFALAADRMVLHAPAGWTVLNQVPSADTGRETVVWREHVHERTYVVLGPDATPTRTAAGQFAVATEVAGWAAGPILGWSVVAILLILAGLEATTVRLDDRATREPTGETHGERFGSLTVTGLVVLAAGVGIVRWHVPASNVIGDVLSAMAGPDSGSSLTAIALFLGLLVVPAVLAFAAAGLLAHRRPAIRWPPAVVAVAILPLEILWMVLIAADAVVLVGIFMVVVALVAAVLGFLAFRLARREAHARGWVSEEDGESWSVDGDEHAGE